MISTLKHHFALSVLPGNPLGPGNPWGPKLPSGPGVPGYPSSPFAPDSPTTPCHISHFKIIREKAFKNKPQPLTQLALGVHRYH